MIRFKGCGTALVTPFREGEVDYAALGGLVRRQIDAGVDFLVPLGSTAETPCLEDGEKIRILEEICSCVGGRLPLLVGVGTNSLKATLRNISVVDSLCKADAYLVVVPYYNKPTQEGMYLYFKEIAAYTDKPLVLYNVPGRTGSNILPRTVLRLAEIPNIVAIKEASGNIAQIREILEGRPEGFSVLSGNDDQTLELMRLGAKGVISVASNIAPSAVAGMTRAALGGDFDRAASLDKSLRPLYDGCFVESNPIPVKAGLSMMGLCTPQMRLPLTTAVDSTFQTLKPIIDAL